MTFSFQFVNLTNLDRFTEENPDLDEFGAHKPVYAVEHLESKFPEFAVDNDLCKLQISSSASVFC